MSECENLGTAQMMADGEMVKYNEEESIIGPIDQVLEGNKLDLTYLIISEIDSQFPLFSKSRSLKSWRHCIWKLTTIILNGIVQNLKFYSLYLFPTYW